MTGPVDIGIGGLRVQALPSGELRIGAPGETPAELEYHHQPQTVLDKRGFFRTRDSGSPERLSWKTLKLRDTIAGPVIEAEGEVRGATVFLTLHSAGEGSVARWPGGAALKLVRQVRFPPGGAVRYGVPFGSTGLDGIMPESGPPKEGSEDELPREEWEKNREHDGWIAWKRGAHEIAVAHEGRGARFEDRAVKMNILTSGGEKLLPDMVAHPVPDEFRTRCTLSFHQGAGLAERAAVEFHSPLQVMVSYANLSDKLPADFSGMTHAPGFALSTLKKSEDGRGYVARGYAFGAPALWPRLLDPERWRLQAANLKEDAITGDPGVRMKPFEIRTVRLNAR
jgi:hypothetical protein